MSQSLSCQDARDALSADLDGMLDAESGARLKKHLAGCDGCSAYAEDIAFLNDILPEHVDGAPNEAVIWERVQGVLDAGEAAAKGSRPDTVTPFSPTRPFRERRAFLKVGMAASIMLAAGVAGGLYLSRPGESEVVAETINDYLTFRASGKALHVVGDAPAGIEAWLEERIDFDLAIASDRTDFRLAGGRLCSFLGRRLAALHFVDGTHAGYRDASLYVMRADGLELPRQTPHALGDRAAHIARGRGVGAVVWKSKGLLHAAVSPMAEDRLLAFAASV